MTFFYVCTCERAQSDHYASQAKASTAARRHLRRCPWAEPGGRDKRVKVKSVPDGETIETWSREWGQMHA